MYDRKHEKPVNQQPSSFLVANLARIEIIDKPILDLACGYGRNGAYLASRGHRVIFVDRDRDCLCFVKSGIGLSEDGDVNPDNIRAMYTDLNTTRLPFPDRSLGGVIIVHYYNPAQLFDVVRMVAVGGFFCFESIGNRGDNLDELPDYRFVRILLDDFEIMSYNERLVHPESRNKSVVKIFAVRR